MSDRDLWADWKPGDVPAVLPWDATPAEVWSAGGNAALAAVRPEYDRVCAERDAFQADAGRLAARHRAHRWVGPGPLDACERWCEQDDQVQAAHDRLVAESGK